MEFSIIIPTYNEAGVIGEQVKRCRLLRPQPEVIVADGNSADGTREIARSAGARVVNGPRRGRAFQMNAGAEASGGDVLIFLHADVHLAQAAYSALIDALTDPSLVGGAFRRRFDSPSPILRLGCLLADARGRWLRIFLGDQAIFVRRAAFRRLGGFPEILLFEDIAFSRRMARLGETRLVEERIIASSRRFDREGNLRRLAMNFILTALYLLGANPNRLAHRYYPGLFAAGNVPGGDAASAAFSAAPGAEVASQATRNSTPGGPA